MSQDFARDPTRNDDRVTGQGFRMPGEQTKDYTLEGAPEGLGTLIAGLVKDLQDLVRDEVKLAKLEIKQDVQDIGKAIGMIAGAAIVGLVGFIFLTAGATLLLDQWIEETWISALIVGAALAIVAAILGTSAKSKLSASNLKPEQTISSLKEDRVWARDQVQEVKQEATNEAKEEKEWASQQIKSVKR